LAIKAFQREKWTDSANWFLESWRILQDEYESALYAPLVTGEREIDFLQRAGVENKARMILGLTTLHDMAKACLYNDAVYKSQDGKYKLQLDPLQSGGSQNTTDRLGHLLAGANSFQEAGFIAAGIYARHCCFALVGVLEKEDEFLYGTVNWMVMYLERIKEYVEQEKMNTEVNTAISATNKLADHKQSLEEGKDMFQVFDDTTIRAAGRVQNGKGPN
jgi:hypothetical protein